MSSAATWRKQYKCEVTERACHDMIYVNKYADGRCHCKNIPRQSQYSYSSIEHYSKNYPHWHIHVTHAPKHFVVRWLRQKLDPRTGGFTTTSSVANNAQFHKMSHIYLHILLAFLFLKSCRVNMLLLCALMAFFTKIQPKQDATSYPARETQMSFRSTVWSQLVPKWTSNFIMRLIALLLNPYVS